MTKLEPYALSEVPNLIESGIFPVQKLSYETQREKNSGSSQILTSLGSYWKGRKPLILVRAIVLGMLLPKTGQDNEDYDIFEKLMAFDIPGLARRALARGLISPKHIIQSGISIDTVSELIAIRKQNSTTYRWKNGVSEDLKLKLIERCLAQYSTYSQQAQFCKRPDEVNSNWLYNRIWPAIRQHYHTWGITACSFNELIEQFGILRFGHRATVGDPFAGGGSIPFESDRLGCNVNASDLNPIACMLNWGASNIINSTRRKRTALLDEIQKVQKNVSDEVKSLEIEDSGSSEKANAYLYCLETKCPVTKWSIPISGSWVISKRNSLVTKLIPNSQNKCFDFELKTADSNREFDEAKLGSVQGDKLTYEIAGQKYTNSIRSIRGDSANKHGQRGNNLRLWSRSDIVARESDIFTERLYAIQWTKTNDNNGRHETYYRVPDKTDLNRENKVKNIVTKELEQWQSAGLIPVNTIEHGQKTTEPIRTRGWTHWHHFFNPRQLLLQKLLFEQAKNSLYPAELLVFATRSIDWNNRGCRWISENGISTNLFYNQAYNLIWNYCSRASSSLLSQWQLNFPLFEANPVNKFTVACKSARNTDYSDIFITDPPYADAVCYHEITEIFISWFRGDLPEPYCDWTWDSRRAMAIKGSGFEFGQKMIEAYSAMASKMPDNGYQCVMFTHSSVKVWANITNILWASGLQVVSAWCVATEKSNSFRDGNHIKGTVLLILRKRSSEPRKGYRQIILTRVTSEVLNQIELMLDLSNKTQTRIGEPAFSDSDIRLAGQAAALRVLTSYSSIGGEDVKAFALRSLSSDTSNVVEEIVSHAIEIANSFLKLESIPQTTWDKLTGLEQFYMQMMELNSYKLETYQNYARIYRVTDYQSFMTNTEANNAQLKLVSQFRSNELTPQKAFGQTWLGQLILALRQLFIENLEPRTVLSNLQNSVSDFVLVRKDLINILEFIELKSPEEEVREATTILKGQLRNVRVFNQ